MPILHFLGLILGMGSGFANLFIASSNKGMDKDEASRFFLKFRATGYMGLTGIALLILSGAT